MIFPELAIVIINLDLKDDTRECIASLLAAGAALDQIIVVDNGSKDGSVEYLRVTFGQPLTVIDAQVNKGYAHGLNLGIAEARRRQAGWVLVLNNDTVFDARFLSELSAAAQRYPQFAMLGPMILYHSEPERIWYLGDRALPGTLITVNRFRDHTSRETFPPFIPVDFLHGCAMLIRADVFDASGVFDDSSLIYGEEIDFSWRARLKGFKAAAIPSARMYHKISTTMKKFKPRTRYLRVRNQIRFYRRYTRGLKRLVMVLFTIARSLYLAAGDVLKRQGELLKPLAWGWIDGWFGDDRERY